MFARLALPLARVFAYEALGFTDEPGRIAFLQFVVGDPRLVVGNRVSLASAAYLAVCTGEGDESVFNINHEGLFLRFIVTGDARKSGLF